MLHRLGRRQKSSFVNSISSIAGKGALPAFDPLTFDVANLAELWDGNNAGALSWVGDHAGNTLVYGRNSTTQIPLPTLVPAGLNGHQYLQMAENGVYINHAQSATPVRTQPTTQYFVLGTNNHIGNRYMFDDGVVSIRNAMRAVNPSPDLRYTSVSSGVTPLSNVPALTTWFVFTIVKQAGLNLSSCEINKLGKDVYTQAVIANDAGLTLNSNAALNTFTSLNSKFAYIILRNGVDSLADQVQFQDYLINRFGL